MSQVLRQVESAATSGPRAGKGYGNAHRVARALASWVAVVVSLGFFLATTGESTARAALSGTAGSDPVAEVRDARPSVLGPGDTWLIECEGPAPAGAVLVRLVTETGEVLVSASGRALGSGRVLVPVTGPWSARLSELGQVTGATVEVEGARADGGGPLRWTTRPGITFDLAWHDGGLARAAQDDRVVGRLLARLGVPAAWRGPAVLFVVALVVMLLVAPLTGVVVVWERKVCGRMQSRLGPNRVGPNGWLQWLADGVKLIVKEDLVPADADPWLFRLSPYLMWMGVFATLVVLPLSASAVVADMNVGLLYLGSVTALTVVGILMGGWASASKWSLLGGMRSAAQIVSYEIPASLSLLAVVVAAGTLSPQEIVAAQGGLPHEWFVFRSPVTFLAFFVYFIAALAEGNRTPFDLPEAESELVAGYNTEYSGFRYSIFYLAEWTNLYVIGAIVSVVFLGGWNVPFVDARALSGVAGELASLLVMVAKIVTVVFVIIWVRWSLPRFRVDQMMSFCWRWLVPLSFALLLLACGWTWFIAAVPLADTLVRWATFLVGGVGLGALFLARVRDNLRRVSLPHAEGRQVRSPFASPVVARPFGLEKRGGTP